jgi:mono/diheme cytochrome c family protein
MKRSLIFLLFALTIVPIGLSARQEPGAGRTSLSDQQILGRRVFRQRCGVCHLPPVPGAKLYGPALYKQLIAGNEDSTREFIMNGSKGKMPGFKYGLEKVEVDAIIEYLKTVEKRRPAKTDNTEGAVD